MYCCVIAVINAIALCVCVCAHTCVCLSLYVCDPCLRVCMSVCVSVSLFMSLYVCMSVLGLGDSMLVIHCHDSWSTIVMMIVLFYYRDSSRHDILMIIGCTSCNQCLVYLNIVILTTYLHIKVQYLF